MGLISIFCTIIILIFLSFIIIACYCSFVVGARADESYSQKEKGKTMEAICEKCNIKFKWHEKDALVKYKYGSKYILHCPYCGKLTKVNID